jgi:phospholipid N-methyltransferase
LLCTLNISLKRTIGDYFDAVHSLKPLENISMRLQRKLQNNTVVSVPAKLKLT